MLSNLIFSIAKQNVWKRHCVLRECTRICKNSLQRLCSRHSLKSCVKSPCTNQARPRFGALCCGVGVSATVLLRIQPASCEYTHKKNRLVGKDRDATDQEPPFSWKELLTFIWPDIWYLMAAVISAFAVAMVNIQIPIVLGDIVNVVSRYTQDTIGNFAEDIKGPAVRLIKMYTLQSGLTFVYISLLSTVGERLAARLRKALFQSIITQDIAFFDTHKTGEIVNRLTSDIQEFKSSFKLCISQGLRSFTQTVGCVVSLFLISPTMTLIMVATVPLMIGAGALIGSGLRKLSRQSQTQVAQATGVADEAIGNVRTVRAFAMEDKEMELYNREVEQAARLNHQLGLGIGMFQALSNLALNGIVLGTLYVGGYMMANQEMKAGGLMSFMVATQTIQRSLAQMSILFGQVVRGISAGARIFEYLNLEPDMAMRGGDVIPYHTMHGDVTFKNVSFTYPSRPNQEILRDFNLKIPAGSMVALVGLSGGGKSTVAGLLERFYDVTEGSICIDKRNIKELDPSWLRGKAIGYINQEPVLFATSVLENIRYGRPDATDADVYAAAEKAHAHTFIKGFPHGYDTVLGERGVTVSGGQKQRIAIARALVKNPSILILDEATSALDAESERVVQEALDDVVKGRTVLVIAHRLSTIKNADDIAVVSQGEIVERGTHEVLKARRGLYWELIRKQEPETQPSNYFSFFSRKR